MSWSIQGVYRNTEHAREVVLKKMDIPENIQTYILVGLAGITEGSGHLCYTGPGGGSYELTSAKLEVRPLQFAP